MSTTPPIIQTTHLTHRYGEVLAVNDLTLSVRRNGYTSDIWRCWGWHGGVLMKKNWVCRRPNRMHKHIMTLLIAVLIGGGLGPSYAQEEAEAVTVRLTIDGVQALDLQEDGGFWSDNLDEMVIIYTLQEIDADGQPVEDNQVGVVWTGWFSLGQRVGLAQYEALNLTIAPTSSVRLAVQMLETEGDPTDYLTSVQDGCDILGGPPTVGEIASNLLALDADTLTCLLGNALGLGDTRLSSDAVPVTYGVGDLRVWQQVTVDFRWRYRPLGVGFNAAHYTLHYTLRLHDPNRPAAFSNDPIVGASHG